MRRAPLKGRSMILQKLLAGVCLAALGACASDPVIEPGRASHGPADLPMPADVAAVTATAEAEKPRSRPKGPALSFAELQGCANLLIAANRHGESLQSSAADLLAERQRLYAAQRALRRDYQALTGASKAAPSDYTEREKALGKATDSYKLKVGLYRASLRNFKNRKSHYRRDCAFRPYSGRDLAALAEVERAEMNKGFLSFRLPRL